MVSLLDIIGYAAGSFSDDNQVQFNRTDCLEVCLKCLPLHTRSERIDLLDGV